MHRAFLLLLSALCLCSCTGDSSSEGTSSVATTGTLNVSGTYLNGSAGVVTGKTGQVITSLRVTQVGDQLVAYDPFQAVYKGSLRGLSLTEGTFQLSGVSDAGIMSTLSGTFTVSTRSIRMEGTWIEPGRSGRILGTATRTTAVLNGNTTPSTPSTLPATSS